MRIAFCGAAGTGKSTLVDELFKLEDFKHYVRYTNIQRTLHHYLGERFPHSKDTNDISQVSIVSNFVLQLLQEENIICDRSLIDAWAYTELADHVTKSVEIEETFNKAMDLYDFIFYTPIEFQIESDGFRDTDIEYINKTDKVIQKYINKYNKSKCHFVTLSGSIEQRVNTMVDVLKNSK